METFCISHKKNIAYKNCIARKTKQNRIIPVSNSAV